MKATRRVFSAVLAFCMVLGMLPLSAFALDSTTLEASIQEARAYIDAITVNSSSNDPETVVKTFKSHFTWDNEKRENSKSYLFDWSYYNGVVFEGIEYLYEVTGDEQYKDYVVEYMSSLISADGAWATCSNDSSKECAGYNSTHGADCYKTASLLLDAYEMTGDGRYLTIAASLYDDLDEAAETYCKSTIGNNYLHTWASDPSPDLWLDGLYMILPFRAEYAKHIADTEELDLIVSRMQWVSDNMYNSSKGLFYHAADSASSNSGTFWLRSIGWYAAAIVDIMDSMEGENLQSMKAQLVKLVDGMKACQNESNGMWLNNMAASESSTNPYETSGTALVCYAVMKAVNNGWLDQSYADMAILAFNGICEEKLENNNLTDICFKGAPGSSNSTFYDNEGKGLGPFIMLCAEVVEYYNNLQDQPAPTETTVPENSEPSADATLVSLEITAQPTKIKYFLNDTLELAGLSVEATFDDGTVRAFGSGSAEGYSITADTGSLGERKLTVSYTWKDVTLTDSCTVTVYERHFSNNASEEVSLDVTVPGVTAVSFRENTNEIQSAVGNRFDRYFSYDITPTGYNQGESVNVTFAVPDGFTARELAAFCVTDSTLTLIPGTYDSATNTYSFSVSHFSTYGLGDVAEVSCTGNLVSTTKQTSIKNGDTIIIGDGNANYLVINGTTISYTQDPSKATLWNVSTSDNYFRLSNGNYYLRPRDGGSSYNLNISDTTSNSGRRNWSYDAEKGLYYEKRNLIFDDAWKMQRDAAEDSNFGMAYKYEGTGAEVAFSVTPGSGSIFAGDTLQLAPLVSVSGTDTKSYQISWTSNNPSIATVDANGKVTAVSAGTASITATLTSANGTALQEDIVLNIPVTVTAVSITGVEAITSAITTCMHQDTDFSSVSMRVTYSNGVTETVTEGIQFGFTKTPGTVTVTATYEGFSDTFPIAVLDDSVESAVMGGKTSFEFDQNTAADFSGLTYTLTYNCGCTEVIDADQLQVSGYNITTPGTYEDCPVTHKGAAIGTVDVVVNERTAISIEGKLVGEYIYKLDTNGVDYGSDNKYLIAASGNPYILTPNGSNSGVQQVSISNNTITLDTNAYEWYFWNNSTQTGSTTYNTLITQNGETWIYHTDSSIYIGNNNDSHRGYWRVESQNNGQYRIGDQDNNNAWRLYYNNGKFTVRTNNSTYVRLFRLDSTTEAETVVFTLDQSAVLLRPDESNALTGSVTVGNATYDLSDCDISWVSNNSGSASVSGGTVTGIADGTTTVTATLNAVNGNALATPISLDVTVTVASKKIESAFIQGSVPDVKVDGTPDYSGVSVIVTYEDGTTGTIPYGQLDFTQIDTSVPGMQRVTVTYGGYEFPLDVKVFISYDGLDDADMSKAPEYPDDGAVRIDKTATEKDFDNTGIVEVELDVAGISVQSAVDVILVTDLSNSMAWAVGGRTDATSYEATKMYDLAQSINSFADIFLAPDENGSATKNTMTLVTFGGYDADYTNKVYTAYADPTQTLISGSSDASAIKTAISNIRILADDTLNIGTSTTGYFLSFDGGENYGENYGNTNYDHAFMQTASAIAELKAAYLEKNGSPYDQSGRSIFVVFMTDGAPSNYDGVYYNYKTGDRADVNCTWINTSGDEATYTMGNSNSQYQAGPWFQYIAGGTYNSTTGTVPGNPLYWADQVYNISNVMDIIAIGFDLDNGGFSSMTFTEADGRPLKKVLEKLVTGQTLDVYEADDAATLNKVYLDLANEIKYAGTSAQVTDLIGKGFTLQTAATSGGITVDPNTGIQIGQVANLSDYGITPHISVKAYDLWTKAETSDTELIGTRKTDADGNYSFTPIETVTFNQDGTEAYSNLLGENKNIMTVNADGSAVIAAKHFTYTRNADGSEDLHWIIGNITDKELAFSFLVYLDGSLDGQVPEGLVYTNESAKLEYIDINGQYAHKEFQSPAAAWGGASTAYEFYLVNDDGKPCDRSGNEIPFANRITITGPYFKELRLNQVDQELAEEIAAAYVLPPGYTLYDATAKYIVVTASGNKEGRLEISTPADGKAQTTVLVSATTPSYIQSRVAFGVKYDEIPTTSTFMLTPDLAVIDYCKPIFIDVAASNTDIPSGYSTELVGFYKFYDTVDQHYQYPSTSCVSPFVANYGIFTIEDGKAVYTPTKLVEGIEKVFAVFKIKTGTNDTYYMVNELTVIPATVMYYETDGSVKDVFSYVDTWSASGTFQDGKQDDYVSDTVNGKQIYGFDSSYENDPELSNGSSMYVAGKSTAANVMTGSPETVAKFTFKGTGFDLIARTGSQQATLRVHVTKQGTKDTKAISVICKGANELWQIPVISVKDLAPGTYNVEIIVYASYTANIPALTQEQNAQLSRGNEFHFDAIRIYDPVKGNATAEAAYMTDGEYSQTISQIGQLLIDKATFQETTSSGVREGTGAVFMDSFTLPPDGDKITEGSGNFFQTSDVGTYDQYGPNNEVYLGQDQGIAFILNTNGTIPASIQIGAKSITGADVVLNAKLVSTNASGQNVVQTSAPPTRTIKTSTALYYELADAAELSKLFANGNQLYVVIWNTGTSVLSITDIKFAYTAAPQAAVTFLYSAELATVAADTISNYDEETYLRKLGDDWFYCNSEGNVIPYSGIVETSDSGMWYIVEGKVDFDFVGLFSTTNGIYSVRNGQVETSLNGIAERDGHWLYFQAGKVDTSFTGIAVYGNSGLWYVKDGVVQLDYSGPVTFDGATYQIENGNVAAS